MPSGSSTLDISKGNIINLFYNPFNQPENVSYISFKNCKVVISGQAKADSPFFFMTWRKEHYYFQVTLNDYVKKGFEPNVSSVAKTSWDIQETSIWLIERK